MNWDETPGAEGAMESPRSPSSRATSPWSKSGRKADPSTALGTTN